MGHKSTYKYIQMVSCCFSQHGTGQLFEASMLYCKTVYGDPIFPTFPSFFGQVLFFLVYKCPTYSYFLRHKFCREYQNVANFATMFFAKLKMLQF